jgi:hypothetical protein
LDQPVDVLAATPLAGDHQTYLEEATESGIMGGKASEGLTDALALINLAVL